MSSAEINPQASIDADGDEPVPEFDGFPAGALGALPPPGPPLGPHAASEQHSAADSVTEAKA